MNEQLLNRIRKCPSLPSLPAIAMQVLDLARNHDSEITEIAHLISKDPALSSKILRTVNSSFYGCSKNISTISHALVILGLQSVKTLVLGFSLVPGLTSSSTSSFNHMHYWKRSLYSAVAARVLAGRLKMVQQEEAFLSALLADIGMLALDQVLGKQYGALCTKVSCHSELVAEELKELDLTHAQAGGFLAQHWNLPPVLAVPVEYHHNPALVKEPTLKTLTELIGLSSLCADVFVDKNPAVSVPGARKALLEMHHLAEPEADAVLDEIGKRTAEAAQLFELNIGSPTDYETVLKKANETLVEITLESQMQATNLQEQNQKLKTQALTDSLTGLANRAHFDQFIAAQFALASKENRPLSLLMMDLDKFKSINDTFGHQAGDQVLQMVAKVLRAAARPQDLSARYGGEEMVLVLPGNNRASAAAVANIIRQAVSKRPLTSDGKEIPVTISIGVATMEPGCPFREPAHLIKAADLAVYAAKNGGRNCVKVFALKPAA